MKPAAFDYYAPTALDEALRLLQELEEPKLLAGGQSLVPLLNMRLAKPRALIDLNRVPALAGIRREGNELVLGAMVRHMQLERDPMVREHVPLLAEAASHIAHLQIRTRGTLGGSLANAAPAAELPAVVLALEATFVLRNRARTRSVRPEDFFTGALQTALAPDELLAEVRVPIPPPGTGCAFVEFARRRGDFALAGAAALVRPDGSRRLALCGVGDVPLRLDDIGALPKLPVRGDLHLSEESRREIAGEIARRALARALERAA